MTRLRSFVTALFGRTRFEDAMADEMRFHLEAYADDLQRTGLSRDEALRRARMEFGAMDAVKEDCREARGLRLFDELRQDLRYAGRIMAKTPAFTAAAVLSLALGIGANTAIFSLMDAVMLRTLPIANPEGLYFLAHGASDRPAYNANYPLYERYRARTEVFSGVAAYAPTGFKVPAPNGVENVTGLWVTGNFHALVGVPISLGRGFAAEPDRQPGGSRVAVISDSYWRRRFGRSPDVLGRELIVDGLSVSIVGVTAPGFSGLVSGQRADITLPLSVRLLKETGFLEMHDSWIGLPIVARLNPGVSESQALAAAEIAFQQYMSEPENQWVRRQDPVGYSAARLVPAGRGSHGLRRQYSTSLSVLMGMVGIILLIASANVANLLLVRSAARAKEVAIRLCVGGGRRRLIRQFLTESLLLALCGGALGVVFAVWGTSGIMGLLSATESPLLLDVTPNLRVLVFTSVIAIVTGLAFGLLPALKATQLDLTPALKEGGGPARESGRRWLTGHVLVVAQVALSALVVAVAGLLVQSVRNLKSIDVGFSGEHVLLFTVDAYGTPLTPAQRGTLYAEMIERLRTLPGVASVSASRSSPIHTRGNARALEIPGAEDTMEARAAWTNMVTPDYFETLGIRVLRGRAFDDHDTATSRKVAVINQTLARFYVGDRDPLGQTIAFRNGNKDPFTIVGVTEDTYQMNLREAPPRTIYTPLSQVEEMPDRMMFELRAVGNPSALAGPALDAARAVSKDVVIYYARTMEEQINASLVRERLLATLSSGFAALALMLSAVGLYGVMSYSVSRRAREIGIRMALGARRGTLVWGVLRQTFAVSAAGIVMGLAGALFATRLLSTLLFGLSPRDPLTLGAAGLLLLATALAAGFVPARRAASVDPVRAIRAE